jgi:hypothetical protein
VPARDVYHDTVKRALEKDGWRITHDPYPLPWEKKRIYIDISAEIVAAEKGSKLIAVEIKSFLGPSDVNDLEKALGQFVLYETLLSYKEPERSLYLAVPNATLLGLFDDSLGQLLIQNKGVRVFGFDPKKEEVTRWLPQRP